MGMTASDDKPDMIPAGASPVRYMVAEAVGATYRNLPDLQAARQAEHAVVVMEGDYGGQIYLTCPVRHIRCDSATLDRLLEDVDNRHWGDPEGAGLYFEIAHVGASIPGGMGGGLVVDGVWLHRELEPLGKQIRAVISGNSPKLDVSVDAS